VNGCHGTSVVSPLVTRCVGEGKSLSTAAGRRKRPIKRPRSAGRTPCIQRVNSVFLSVHTENSFVPFLHNRNS